MNKTQFLYWLHKYFCGSCLHSLGLSYRSVWGSFRVCIEPWTVLGCFWSRYYRYPSFSSVSSFLSVFPDCHPNTPQCVVLAALIPCGRAGGSGEVMRVESVPHLRSCLREGTCLVGTACRTPLTPPGVNPVLCHTGLLPKRRSKQQVHHRCRQIFFP